MAARVGVVDVLKEVVVVNGVTTRVGGTNTKRFVATVAATASGCERVGVAGGRASLGMRRLFGIIVLVADGRRGKMS